MHGERLSHEMGYSGATYCNYGNSCLRPSGGLDYCCCCYMNIGQDRWLAWFNKVNHSRKEKLVNETVIDKTFVSGCLFKFPPRNGPAQLNTTRTLGSFSTLTESSRERLKVAKSNIIATELRGFSPFSLKVILVWFFWTFLSLSFACSPFSLRGRIRFFRFFFASFVQHVSEFCEGFVSWVAEVKEKSKKKHQWRGRSSFKQVDSRGSSYRRKTVHFLEMS